MEFSFGNRAIKRRRIHRYKMKTTQPAFSFEPEVFPSLVGHGPFGFVSDDFFLDIDAPEDYEREQTEISRRSLRARSNSR